MPMGLKAASIAGTIVMVLGIGFEAGQVLADQPHMQAALDALMRAKRELTVAAPDKGGHRLVALQAVDRAIYETRAGMGYAREH